MGVYVISALQSIMNGFDFTPVLNILERLIPSLICITLHEISHGLAALALGDPTAKNAGRLTLNPVKHIDLTGLLMMVLFRVGWAKPVPVSMRNFRHPRRDMALTAAAGPLSNLVIAVVFFFLYGFFYVPLEQSTTGNFVLELLYITAYLSVCLGVFNLIPLPPLDGSRILGLFLSDRIYYMLMRYERYISLAMFVVFALGIVSGPVGTATEWVTDRIFWFAEQGYRVSLLLF